MDEWGAELEDKLYSELEASSFFFALLLLFL